MPSPTLEAAKKRAVQTTVKLSEKAWRARQDVVRALGVSSADQDTLNRITKMARSGDRNCADLSQEDFTCGLVTEFLKGGWKLSNKGCHNVFGFEDLDAAYSLSDDEHVDTLVKTIVPTEHMRSESVAPSVVPDRGIHDPESETPTLPSRSETILETAKQEPPKDIEKPSKNSDDSPKHKQGSPRVHENSLGKAAVSPKETPTIPQTRQPRLQPTSLPKSRPSSHSVSKSCHSSTSASFLKPINSRGSSRKEIDKKHRKYTLPPSASTMQDQLLNVATVHEAKICNTPKSKQPKRTGQEKERERKQRAKLMAMLDKREKERHMREARSKMIMQRPDYEYNGVNSSRSSSSRPSPELGSRLSTPSQRSSSSTVGQKRRCDDREDRPSKRISTGP